VGSGAAAALCLFIAKQTGCRVTGIDINEYGIRNANALARQQSLEHR